MPSQSERPGIRLTFVTHNIRGSVEHYDTESLNEAMHRFIDAHLQDSAGDRPTMPEKWIFAVVVERDQSFQGDEAADRFYDIAQIEVARAHRA